MEIQEVKRYMKLREWSAMIQARKASGQTVKAWCKENRISIKTYYYRLKRIRLAALQEPEKAGEYLLNTGASPPTFAKLQFRDTGESISGVSAFGSIVLSVRLGPAVIDINNDANPDTIAATLHALRDIC